MEEQIKEILNLIKKSFTCTEGMVTLLRVQGHNDCSTKEKYNSENEITWIAELMCLVKRLGVDITGFESPWRDYLNAINKLKIEPGLYNRHVDFREDNISWDEMASIAVISALANYPFLAMTMYDYGKKNWWVYNNTNYKGFFNRIKWTIKCYRRPREVIFYKACAGIKLNFIEKEILELSMMGTVSKKSDKRLHPHQDVPGMFVKNGKKYIGDYHQVSGRMMAWRKIMALVHVDPQEWTRLKEKWEGAMEKKYGPEWLKIIHNIYFERRFTGHEIHPFLMLLDLK